MLKLIDAFIVNPNDKTRAKLQAYLSKHTMAVCMATTAQIDFLRINKFNL